MSPTKAPRRYSRASFLPVVMGGALLLVGAGVLAASDSGHLTEPTAADKAAAAADYDPPTGLDTRAPLPGADEVGGAGAIEPADRPVSLNTEVAGVVAEVLVSEGEQVEAGQPLIRLRSETAAAQVAAAEADVRTAISNLAAARADADAAAARAALSEASAARTDALADRGTATPEDRDRADLTRKADAATVRASRARADQAASALRAAQARETLTRAQADQLVLTAPIAGEVLQVLVRPGEATSPSSVVLVMGDTRTLRARLDINERDALGIVPGQRARVRIEGAREDIGGTVVEVARRVGRKNVRTDNPTDRQDVRFVETVVELDTAPHVPMGIRVQGYVTLGD